MRDITINARQLSWTSVGGHTKHVISDVFFDLRLLRKFDHASVYRQQF